MSDILSGKLPSTPVASDHTAPDSERSSPRRLSAQPARGRLDRGGFLARPSRRHDGPASDLDNTPGHDGLSDPGLRPGLTFGQQVIDSLDATDDARSCGDNTVDGITEGPAVGYVTIDHANYC